MNAIHLRQCLRSTGRCAALALAVLVLALSASCGRFHRGGEVAPQGFIVFINRSLDQADVYVVVPGSESRRIGTVMSGRTDTLTVPADITARAGTVEIAARLLARSIVPRTGPISLGPGEWLEVTLPSDEKVLTVLPAGP
jgi:hypothetical protein